MKQTFTFIDLFCGIGGFRLALESVGGVCVFSSDKNKRARETYFANFNEMPAGDITKIAAEDIPAFDVLCGGFPCQPFSQAGKQLGFSDPRGNLFFEIARIVKFHQPKVLFLENVQHLAKHDDGNTLRAILDTLDSLGYNAFCKILKASDYGVAQIRRRIYFVCFRKDLDADFSFPEPTYEDVAVEDFLETYVDEKYFLNEEQFKNITFYKEDTTERRLDTYRLGYIGVPGQGRRIYSIKGCTPTFVCTSIGPVGNTEGYLINGRVRKLTPCEAKRIMGFPEDFIFPVSDAKAYEQLGNSVAVPVLKAIAGQIVRTGVLDRKADLPARQGGQEQGL